MESESEESTATASAGSAAAVPGSSVTAAPGRPVVTALERRYRRLLLAYPAAYRRRHGDELITTLLDAAGTDRVRPGRRDTVDLLRGGLRQRFRLPVGKAPVAAAVFAAFVSGALGAGIGSFLGWCTTPPLRVDAGVAQIAGLAIGEPYVGGFSRDDRWQFRAVKVEAVDPRYIPGWTSASAADRFTTAGWTVEPTGTSAFTARRGTLRAWVTGPLPAADHPAGVVIWPDPSAGPVSVVIWPAEPAAVTAGVVTGWLTGAVAGWLLVAWVAYQLRGDRSWARRGTVAVLTAVAVLLLLRPVLWTYLLIVTGAVSSPDRWGPPSPAYIGFIDSDAVAVPLFGLAAIAAACLVAARAHPHPTPATVPSHDPEDLVHP
ncbi:hypothetical protein GCM10027610_075880 [Dactylosporangium cerinum]